jgi:hypothetical protein
MIASVYNDPSGNLKSISPEKVASADLYSVMNLDKKGFIKRSF